MLLLIKWSKIVQRKNLRIALPCLLKRRDFDYELREIYRLKTIKDDFWDIVPQGSPQKLITGEKVLLQVNYY